MKVKKVELANQKKKCSPKGYAVINSLDFIFVVDLAPQQRWYFEIKDNGRYKVERQNLTLTITKEQFDKYFEEIGGKYGRKESAEMQAKSK